MGLRGFFKTNSADTDPGTPNCYFFPRSGGMFLVVRFQTQDEHESWGRTAKGERCCFYNCPLDLRTACGMVKGIWTGKACTCERQSQATQLAAMFGFQLPPLASDRAVTFHYADAHTIVAETDQVKGEIVNGWGLGYRRLAVSFEVEPPQLPDHDYYSEVRHVVTAERENAGYLMRSDNNEWLFEPKGTAEDRLAHRFGLSSGGIKDAMGQIAGNPYVLVNEPFQPEFPGGRTWNKFGSAAIRRPNIRRQA